MGTQSRHRSIKNLEGVSKTVIDTAMYPKHLIWEPDENNNSCHLDHKLSPKGELCPDCGKDLPTLYQTWEDPTHYQCVYCNTEKQTQHLKLIEQGIVFEWSDIGEVNRIKLNLKLAHDLAMDNPELQELISHTYNQVCEIPAKKNYFDDIIANR